MAEHRALDWSVIVLGGGRATRLGGLDKSAVDLGGRTTLDRLLSTLPTDVDVIVAGPPQAVHRPVRFRMEEPRFGGPVAGIAAALPDVTTPAVALAAVDAPWGGALLDTLVEHLRDHGGDAVIPTDIDGRRQVLLSAWRTSALRSALDRLGDPRGRAVRELETDADVVEFPLTPDQQALTLDIDTEADLERAQRLASGPTLVDLNGNESEGAAMDEWIEAVRRELGLDAAVDVGVILDVARVAAHNVARPAAPVTTYLLGVAAAGGMDAKVASEAIERLAAAWPPAE
jgi:molybdopterin-guanine dinucleotide biosynthesis protein A